jgi:general secretion pathway protein B
MSFILDALKKSETDRQQQGNAEFSAVPIGPRATSIPRWFWIVGVLLAINLAVLISLLLQPDSSPSTTQAAVSTINRPSQPEVTLPPSFEEQVATARQNVPAQQEADAKVEVAADTVRAVLISQNPSSVSSDDLHPTLQEIRARGALNLPELHLDIHVYSDEPKDRFVFINMTKLREGSQLAEGPVVAEITPDGVVLGHQGQFFILPRE